MRKLLFVQLRKRNDTVMENWSFIDGYLFTTLLPRTNIWEKSILIKTKTWEKSLSCNCYHYQLQSTHRHLILPLFNDNSSLMPKYEKKYHCQDLAVSYHFSHLSILRILNTKFLKHYQRIYCFSFFFYIYLFVHLSSYLPF